MFSVQSDFVGSRGVRWLSLLALLTGCGTPMGNGGDVVSDNPIATDVTGVDAMTPAPDVADAHAGMDALDSGGPIMDATTPPIDVIPLIDVPVPPIDVPVTPMDVHTPPTDSGGRDVTVPTDTGPAGTHTGASLATCATTPCTAGTIPMWNQHALMAVPSGDGTNATRYYGLYRPANLVGTAATVIVFARQMGSSGPGAINSLTAPRWNVIADQNRLQIAIASANGANWNHLNTAVPPAPPGSLTDEPYVTALIADLVTNRNADPLRIYVTGGSSAGAMTKDVACDTVNAPLVRGVAVISHDAFETQIASAAPVAGTERCVGGGPNTAMQIVVGGSDGASGNGLPLCLTDHCFDGLTVGGQYYARILGCGSASSVPAPVMFGTPTMANSRYTWAGPCRGFTSAAMESVFVHSGGHMTCALDSEAGYDTTACAMSPNATNGYWTAQDNWRFFSNLRW